MIQRHLHRKVRSHLIQDRCSSSCLFCSAPPLPEDEEVNEDSNKTPLHLHRRALTSSSSSLGPDVCMSFASAMSTLTLPSPHAADLAFEEFGAEEDEQADRSVVGVHPWDQVGKSKTSSGRQDGHDPESCQL
eukprot:105866-Hanusia_phi.AAC.1